MSETFIDIDSMQHLEILRQTYPTNRSKNRPTTITVLTLCRSPSVSPGNLSNYKSTRERVDSKGL